MAFGGYKFEVEKRINFFNNKTNGEYARINDLNHAISINDNLLQEMEALRTSQPPPKHFMGCFGI